MNDNLVRIINLAKQKLKENPKSILFGNLENGEGSIPDSLDFSIYYEFLKVCNGARCGDIDLWNTNSYLYNQFYIDDMDGGHDVWLCIGQILYEPLMLNKHDERVYLFNREKLDDSPIYIFEGFYDLMINYVFGKGYKDVVSNAESDAWYIFLKENNFFNE